jgi:flagellar protein FlaG
MNIDRIQSAGVPPQVHVQQDTPSRTPSATQQASTSAAQSANKSGQSAQKTDEGLLKRAVEQLSQFVSLSQSDINFSIDDASGMQVVKIVDRQSNEVIRQIPSEEAIQIAQALDKLQGLFVRDKA